MILRALVTTALAAVLLTACASTEEFAYFPSTRPYSLPNVERGTHLTHSQAIELAISVAVQHRTNPANYGPPEASYKNHEWYVFFGEGAGPPTPALGHHFSVYIYESNNTFSFSPGR
jgi:hypothetical protein